ncbi:MAG: hypothetical protein HY049_17000 [Acidobacteria bacterium]|nr:hypothetical protein [Acidobacteriota bacterium]
MRARGALAPALVLALAASSPATAAWVGEIQTGVTSDDNVNRARRGADERGDGAATFSGFAGERFQLSTSGSLTLLGTLAAADFSRFDGLDRVMPGGSVAWTVKTRLGAGAPWIQIAASAAHDDVRDAAREGWLYQGRVRSGWQAGPVVTMTAEGSWTGRTAHDEVFGQRATALSLRADAAPWRRIALHASYEIRRGDVTSSSPKDPAARAASKTLLPDAVFGAAFVAYRLEATSHDLKVGLNLAAGRHASFDLSVERVLALATAGLDYTIDRATGVFLYRF